jgi:hypothetical protein
LVVAAGDFEGHPFFKFRHDHRRLGPRWRISRAEPDWTRS